MEPNEIEQLKKLLSKFLNEYVNIQKSPILNFEYNAENQSFYITFNSFGKVNSFCSVDAFVNHVIMEYDEYNRT